MRGLNPDQRKRIVDIWRNENGISMRAIAKLEDVSLKAVSNTIRKYNHDLSFQDKPKTGRPRGSSNVKLDSTICSSIEKMPCSSIRDISRKCKTSVGMVQRVKKRNGFTTYKKQKAPKRSPKQAESVKPRLRKLYDCILTKKQQCIIMDDETYVKFDYSSLPGPQFYTVQKGTDLPKSKKVIAVEKFGLKAMVWQAICECGLKSAPFVTTSTMTSDVYIEQCLKKSLLPMICLHEGDVLFWPDLAAIHYSKKSVEWMSENGVSFVEKSMNPPNCPEIRPIEKFWAIMKAKLRKDFKPSGTIDQFRKDWLKASKKIDNTVVQNLMSTVRRKVRKIAKE